MANTPATITVNLKDWKKVHERVEEMSERYQQAIKNQIDVINRLMGRMREAEQDAEGAKRVIALILEQMGNNDGTTEIQITTAEMVRISREKHIVSEFDQTTGMLKVRLADGPQPIDVPKDDNNEEKQDV